MRGVLNSATGGVLPISRSAHRLFDLYFFAMTRTTLKTFHFTILWVCMKGEMVRAHVFTEINSYSNCPFVSLPPRMRKVRRRLQTKNQCNAIGIGLCQVSDLWRPFSMPQAQAAVGEFNPTKVMKPASMNNVANSPVRRTLPARSDYVKVRSRLSPVRRLRPSNR